MNIFDFMRRKRAPQLTLHDVISRYGALLEKYPIAIVDTSMLPLPKKHMKVVLKGAFARESDPDKAKALETGFMLLCNFQEGVGAVPISGELPKPSDDVRADAAATVTILDRWMPWQKLAVAEADILLAEWRRFKAGEPM